MRDPCVAAEAALRTRFAPDGMLVGIDAGVAAREAVAAARPHIEAAARLEGVTRAMDETAEVAGYWERRVCEMTDALLTVERVLRQLHETSAAVLHDAGDQVARALDDAGADSDRRRRSLWRRRRGD